MVIRQCKSCQIEPAMDEKSASYGGGSPCEGLPRSFFRWVWISGDSEGGQGFFLDNDMLHAYTEGETNETIHASASQAQKGG